MNFCAAYIYIYIYIYIYTYFLNIYSRKIDKIITDYYFSIADLCLAAWRACALVCKLLTVLMKTVGVVC